MAEQPKGGPLNDDELNRLAEFIDTKDVDEFLIEWTDGVHKTVVIHAWSDAWSLLRRLLNVLAWHETSNERRA